MKLRALVARIRRQFIAGVLLALASVAPALAAPKPGDIAPDFAGRTYEGQSISVAAYTGKVVVLSFWASWCGPCRKELPILESIQQVAGKERVPVVAINIEDRNTFRKIARKLTSFNLLLATDTSGHAQRAYGVNGIPHMVIISKSGQIMRVHQGYAEEALDDIVKDLNQAVAE